MHEYSVVESCVQQLLKELPRRGAKKVFAVRFRRGSAFSEDALRMSFAALTKGTLLEGAELRIETVNLDYACKCGHRQVITGDDVIAHMFICPQCGATKEIDEVHDLELLDVEIEEETKS